MDHGGESWRYVVVLHPVLAWLGRKQYNAYPKGTYIIECA
jgi:hypothetical protein